MSNPFERPQPDPMQTSLVPEDATPILREKRTGPYNLDFSPCVMCNAYRAVERVHGWGFCSLLNEFVRGNGCCGLWDATGKT